MNRPYDVFYATENRYIQQEVHELCLNQMQFKLLQFPTKMK